MRIVPVDGIPGIIAAKGSGLRAGKVFVLFDGDNASEDNARWMPAESVTVTGTVPVTF